MYLHGFVHVDTAKVAVLKTFVHVWDGSNCECLQPWGNQSGTSINLAHHSYLSTCWKNLQCTANSSMIKVVFAEYHVNSPSRTRNIATQMPWNDEYNSTFLYATLSCTRTSPTCFISSRTPTKNFTNTYASPKLARTFTASADLATLRFKNWYTYTFWSVCVWVGVYVSIASISPSPIHTTSSKYCMNAQVKANK